MKWKLTIKMNNINRCVTKDVWGLSRKTPATNASIFYYYMVGYFLDRPPNRQ